MPPVRANLYQAEFNYIVDTIPHQHRTWLVPQNFNEAAGLDPTDYGLLTQDGSVVNFAEFIVDYSVTFDSLFDPANVTFGNTTLYRVADGTQVREFLTESPQTITPASAVPYGPAETRTFTAVSFANNTIILRFSEPSGASIVKRPFNPTTGNVVPDLIAAYLLDRSLCPICDLEASHVLVTRNEVQRVNSALQDIRFNLS